MSTIANMAFDSSVTPYANDPLLLHLRLKNCPENIEVYQGMADSFKSAFGEKHLLKPIFGREYWAKSPGDSGTFSHYNLGEVPVVLLMGKVIIMVDQIPSVVRACEAKTNLLRLLVTFMILSILQEEKVFLKLKIFRT